MRRILTQEERLVSTITRQIAKQDNANLERASIQRGDSSKEEGKDPPLATDSDSSFENEDLSDIEVEETKLAYNRLKRLITK
jgi:hypothetical protein